jgi:hypothetical protein
MASQSSRVMAVGSQVGQGVCDGRGSCTKRSCQVLLLPVGKKGQRVKTGFNRCSCALLATEVHRPGPVSQESDAQPFSLSVICRSVLLDSGEGYQQTMSMHILYIILHHNQVKLLQHITTKQSLRRPQFWVHRHQAQQEKQAVIITPHLSTVTFSTTNQRK